MIKNLDIINKNCFLNLFFIKIKYYNFCYVVIKFIDIENAKIAKKYGFESY